MHVLISRFFPLVLIFSISIGCSNSSGANNAEMGSEDPVTESLDIEMSDANPEIEISPTTINTFLWKPESERNGNLVVLIDPVGIRVEVTGVISETLTDSGPSNGRGTTARASFPGCAFGNNVKVEFFDGKNRRVTLTSGARAVTVPAGCARFQV